MAPQMDLVRAYVFQHADASAHEVLFYLGQLRRPLTTVAIMRRVLRQVRSDIAENGNASLPFVIDVANYLPLLAKYLAKHRDASAEDLRGHLELSRQHSARLDDVKTWHTALRAMIYGWAAELAAL
jgi:hypothetical protein